MHVISILMRGCLVSEVLYWYSLSMQVLILYQPHGEFARRIEEYVENFRQVYPDHEHELTLMDADSVEGSQKAEVYGIMQRPAILALANDGSLLHSWLGSQLPLADEVVGYLR